MRQTDMPAHRVLAYEFKRCIMLNYVGVEKRVTRLRSSFVIQWTLEHEASMAKSCASVEQQIREIKVWMLMSLIVHQLLFKNF